MPRALASMVASLLIIMPLAAQSPEQKQATIKFLQDLQTTDGGFAPAPPDSRVEKLPRGSLRATSASLRALKYFGGKPKDRAAAAKFIRSCYDPKAGGFSDQPGGRPDVFSTAVGVMAVVEAGLTLKEYAAACQEFLANNAMEFEDIRIAAAGFETIGRLPPIAEKWRKDLMGRANADGAYGRGADRSRSTGGAVVTVLRLGGKLDDAAKIIALLNEGQNADGAWGKDDSGASDLETSYRIMRCYHMLKSKPKNVERVRAFITKCRNDDCGYGVKPGQASSAGGTYFAGIILNWLRESE